MVNGDEILLHAKRFQVVRKSQRAPDGSSLLRDIVVHPGSVVILPLLPDQRICLIRNYRIAVGEALIELPAGTLDQNEDAGEAARRELIEETGYRATRMEKLFDFYPSPGILDERMQLFVADGLTAGEPARETGEEIDNMIIAIDDALELVRAGSIRDAKTLVGLLLYDAFLRRAA